MSPSVREGPRLCASKPFSRRSSAFTCLREPLVAGLRLQSRPRFIEGIAHLGAMPSRCAICCGMVPSLSSIMEVNGPCISGGVPATFKLRQRERGRHLVFLPMVSRARQSTRDLARYITRAVYEATDGQPRRWRTLSTIPGATAASAVYAAEQGWIELEGAHSACLTEEGRRMIAKEAH